MDGYEQICVAGEGAYGIVLKCRRRDSGEIVAIKQFKENDEEEEEASKMIHREIQILKLLKHEHIVDTREVFREQGLLHIVCEYVDKCLLDILEANPNGLDPETIRIIIYQLTQAVEYCHRNNVIHRDIKPDNLLIHSSNNSLKLCDFGSACILSGQQVLTDYAATRWYRAPELLVRFNDYGPGVDIWGLGCVMAELINGQPLFAGKSDIDQVFIINNAVGPLTSQQTKRCFDLTGFVRFPEVRERQPLSKLLGPKATSQQVQFLSRVFVVDPSQRISARTALSLPWLANRSGSQAQASASQIENNGGYLGQSRISSGDPDSGLQPKPRISKVIGVSGAPCAKDRAIGILAGAQEVLGRACQEAAIESVSSFRDGSTWQASQAQPQGVCEIAEEISDGSVTEELDCNSRASPSLKNNLTIPDSPETFSTPDQHVGIVAKTSELSTPEIQETKTAMQINSVTESHEIMSQSVFTRQDSRKQLEQSIQESMDYLDESIVEELSLENTNVVQIEKPIPKAALRPSAVASRGSGKIDKRSSQPRHLIRPVSGNSAHSSSLTPMF